MAKSPTWNETPRADRAWDDPKRGKMPRKMDVEAEEGAEDQARALREQRRGAAGERSAE